MHKIRSSDVTRLIALSRDIAKRFKYGQRFLLKVGDQTYKVRFLDLMHKRWRNRVDLLLRTRRQCIKFGVKDGVLIPINN
jgi:3D (Asp-Asp-Asp) domain-containing protein